MPADARFAAFPTYNHPLLLQGRKLVLGYPGHVWTQGFNYGEDANKLTALMNGAPGWKETAEKFRARYLFWGREEIRNYPQSTRPWEKESKLVTNGPWGAIYDLESPSSSSGRYADPKCLTDPDCHNGSGRHADRSRPVVGNATTGRASHRAPTDAP